MPSLKNSELLSKDALSALEELMNDRNIQNGEINISSDNKNVKAQIKGITGKPLHLIVKKSPQNCEKYMYTKVLPELARIKQEKRILDPFRCFATCYKSAKNGDLLIGDLQENGFEKTKQFDCEHVKCVLIEFGKFHAMSLALHEQNAEKVEEFSRGFQNDALLQAVKNEKSFKYIQDRLSNMDRNAEEKLRVFQEYVSNANADMHTVVHGSSSANNLMFKYQKNATPSIEVCFPDWQTARLGSPAFDLAYFLFTSTDKEFRFQHYEHMLEVYYGSLCTYLHLLGCNPAKVFPFRLLQEHMKNYSVYVLYMLYYVKSTEAIGDQEFVESTITDIIQDFVKYKYL